MLNINRNKYFLFLNIFILLTPLLYGILGRSFTPFFFVVLVALTYLGEGQPQRAAEIPFGRPLKLLIYALPVYPLLQIVPLPMFLLKYISPSTLRTLRLMQGDMPYLHSVSLVPLETLIVTLQMVAILLFFRMILVVTWEKQEMLRLLNTVIFSAILLMVFGLARLMPAEAGRESRYFSFYLAMVFPLAPSLLFMGLRYIESNQNVALKLLASLMSEKKIAGYFAACTLLPAGLLLTRSRIALVVLFLSCAVFFLWSYYFKQPYNVRKRIKTAFIIASLVIVLLGLQWAVKQLGDREGHRSSEVARWRSTLSMTRAYPLLGAGLGTWQWGNVLYDRTTVAQWPPHTNNGYIQLAAETGLLGMGLLGVILTLFTISIFKMWWHRRHPQMKMIGLGVVTALFAALIHFIFNTALITTPNLLIFTLLMGLAVKIGTYKKKQGRGVTGDKKVKSKKEVPGVIGVTGVKRVKENTEADSDAEVKEVAEVAEVAEAKKSTPAKESNETKESKETKETKL